MNTVYWISFFEGGAGWTYYRRCSKKEYDKYKHHWQYRVKITYE